MMNYLAFSSNCARRLKCPLQGHALYLDNLLFSITFCQRGKNGAYLHPGSLVYILFQLKYLDLSQLIPTESCGAGQS